MNTFNSLTEYQQATQMHDAYNAARQNWLKANKTNGIPVEICNTFPHAEVVNNDLRSKIEVWEFVHDKPKAYFLYINESNHSATGWTGEKLGNVVFGNEFRSNMGDKRQAIDVFGINGIKYHGIYYKSAGDYARIKAYKNQTLEDMSIVL